MIAYIILFLFLLLYCNKATLKPLVSYLLSGIIVLLFFKLQLICLSKILSFYWLIPIFSGISVILVLIIRNEINLGKNRIHNNLQVRKVILLFLIAFASSVLSLILAHCLIGNVSDIIILSLDIDVVGASILLIPKSYIINEPHVFMMNTASDGNTTPGDNTVSDDSMSSSPGSSSSSTWEGSPAPEGRDLTDQEYMSKRLNWLI